MFDIIVLGGGASGFAAAITAAKIIGGKNVAIVEGGDRVLKKLALTGNGQCNLTNVKSGKYFGDEALANSVISEVSVEETLKLFSSIGVEHVTEEDGKVYPLSKQASSVCDCLRFEAERLGIEVFLNERINNISKTGEVFEINTSGKDLFAKKVIYALGGAAYPKLLTSKANVRLLDSFNIKTAPYIPALVQLSTDSQPLRSIKGIKTNVLLSILIDNVIVSQKCDEIHFAGNAISGPATFSLSPYATIALSEGKKVKANIDFFPNVSENELYSLFTQRRDSLSHLTAERFFITLIHSAIGRMLVKAARIPFDTPFSLITNSDISRLCRLSKCFEINITDSFGFNFAQASVGGVVANELDSSLMSKRVEGLYFAGESINVAGECGGYNLQFAWSSGILCGRAAANALLCD